MSFDKHRFEVWNQTQHPYKHTLSDFAYSNPSLPGVSDVNAALNWLIKVLYPNAKAAVADVASLPLIGNTLNDYRVVLDDGDGNNAGYRWEQREGEVSASWHKVFDFDWSTDSILASLTDITQFLYVYQNGKTDLDASGAAIVGTYAGQRIYGGNLANQNLTLEANSGDGTGAATGYIQFGSTIRPAVASVGLGTNANRFDGGFFDGTVRIADLFLQTGQITDLSGQISFDNENLVTTGNITGTTGYYTTSVEVGPLVGDALVLAAGSITDQSGAISFGNENLSTSGTLGAGVTTLTDNAQTIVFDPDVAGKAQITASNGTIDFDNEDLETTGAITAGSITLGALDVDNININGNTISSTDTNGNIILLPDGTGVVDVQKVLQTLDQVVTGNVGITGDLDVDNININGNVISATNVNGSITLTPNGSGIVEASSHIKPGTDDVFDLGDATHRFDDLFINGTFSDGTLAMAMADLVTLRDINVGVAAGMALFYDGSKWVASAPDTEITHSSLSGLTTGDAGHTQFALLAGRAGGQSLIGGTGSGETLVLESTAHATKGTISLKDDTIPFATAVYAAGWTGVDLGDSSHYFNDIYSKGVHVGFRFENYTSGTLPSPSVQNVGRAVWATDNNKLYVDTGTSFVAAGVAKFISDTSWDGILLTQTFTVSSTIADARNAIWQLMDNTNNFEIIFPKIEAISATQVRVTVNPALPAGSYRLIGIE